MLQGPRITRGPRRRHRASSGAKAVGVPVTPARMPLSKSARTRARDLVGAAVALEALEVERPRSALAPRDAGRPGGRGRRRSSRRTTRRPRDPAATPPLRPRAAPASAGAARRSGNVARTGAPLEPPAPARRPRTPGSRGRGRRSGPARRRERGHPGRSAGPRRWRSPRKPAPQALRAAPPSGCLTSSASKIRFAPGIVSGVCSAWTQRTMPSSSISTSERLLCPRSSIRRRRRGRPRPSGGSRRAA